VIGAKGVRAVVTDIEGTTSSIRFVHEVLFPYARDRLAGFVATHRDSVASLLAEVRAMEGREDLDEAAVCGVLRRWMDEDRKATPLKALQGMIWREGYESGALTADIYDDTAPALRAWRDRGLRLFVYSSGSVEAQKLLFGHSAAGDLTPLFEGYFDTRVGAKAEAASYARIAEAIVLPPTEILFLSDAPSEIAAARAAGLQAIRVVRDGPRAEGEAASFDEISVI
jgi:enolase-phosphatase E1